jgi:hypothetical protein
MNTHITYFRDELHFKYSEFGRLSILFMFLRICRKQNTTNPEYFHEHSYRTNTSIIKKNVVLISRFHIFYVRKQIY